MAITCGLPIVYCDSNLKEGLTRENSKITEGIEGKDFAKTFDSLLNDKKRLKEMSKASLKLAYQFDINLLANKLLQFYKEAIEKKKSTQIE